MTLILAISAFVVVNAAAIIAFAIDKQRATNGEWRIRESTLLSLAMVGGAAGACWARHRFRHKTRKQPFSTQLDLIMMVQVGLAFGLGVTLFMPT